MQCFGFRPKATSSETQGGEQRAVSTALQGILMLTHELHWVRAVDLSPSVHAAAGPGTALREPLL